MSHILITGGAGYLGRPLCLRLLNAGHDVLSLDRGLFGLAQAQHSRFGNIPADTRIYEVVERAMKEADVVVHMAFVNGAGAAKKADKTAHHTNLLGSQNVIEAADLLGVKKLIIVSDAFPTSERPSGDHGDAAYIQQRKDVFGLLSEMQGAERTFLELPMLCGWSPRMRFDLIVNRMVAEAVQSGVAAEPTVKTTIPVLHVQDAVTALKLAIDAPVHHGVHRMEVGGEEIDLRDIVSALKRLNADLKVMEGPMSLQSFKTDGEAFKEKYGFGRTIAIEEGVKEVAQGILKMGPSMRWTDPIYHNKEVDL